MAKAIEVKNLFKLYKDKIAVENVSFSIEFGKITALLGSNGAGKSTTLNLIAGISGPTEGEVIVNSMNYQNHYKEIKQILGYLTSEMSLYETFSVKENLEMLANLKSMDKQKTKYRIDYLVEQFNLKEFIESKFSDLSSGQKQRSLIAASIIHDPQILIFDEVTASLDILISKEIMDFLAMEKKKGKAILFSTHILSEVEYLSDNILIIEHGKLVQETNYKQLIENNSAENITEAFYKELKKGRVA